MLLKIIGCWWLYIFIECVHIPLEAHAPGCRNFIKIHFDVSLPISEEVIKVPHIGGVLTTLLISSKPIVFIMVENLLLILEFLMGLGLTFLLNLFLEEFFVLLLG